MVGRRFSMCFSSLYHHIRRAMPRSVQRVVLRVSCEHCCTIVTFALEGLLASKGKCPSQVASSWRVRGKAGQSCSMPAVRCMNTSSMKDRVCVWAW